MTKSEIAGKISEKTGIEKTTTLAVIESFMMEVKDSLKNNESVFLRGFGTFSSKERKEKTGRNISKNTTIIIPSHYTPSFKPSRIFKEEIKNNINS
tara:strand:- start:106 stop:393 length:288 start_codon:yes stop_codon:yes gene_type:complete